MLRDYSVKVAQIMASKKFGRFGAFKPVQNYGLNHGYYKSTYSFMYDRDLECDIDVFANIITAENELRTAVQREESLENRSECLKRAWAMKKKSYINVTRSLRQPGKLSTFSSEISATRSPCCLANPERSL